MIAKKVCNLLLKKENPIGQTEFLIFQIFYQYVNQNNCKMKKP